MASSASASFLYQRSSPGTNTLVYAGLTTNEVNIVTAERNAGQEFVFTDATTLIDDGMPGYCRAGAGPNQVICATESSPGSPFTSVDFELHSNNDYVNNRLNLPSRIEGGVGDDILNGGSAGDVIIGNGDFDGGPDGNDIIDGRGGADSMHGDDGIDTVTYASITPRVDVSIDGIANDGGISAGEGDNVHLTVENVVGSKSGDFLTGNGSANELSGGGGFDFIDGLGGADELNGNGGGDDLDGGDGPDRLWGMDGGDTLSGGLDADRLTGGEGDDRAVGGAGADFFSGGGGVDDVDYSSVSAPLRVTVPDGAANDGATGEGDNVRPDNERIFGGSGDDRLYGTNDGGEIYGRAGNDWLFGGDNDDRLEGEDGNDRLEGGYRGDRMFGGNGLDTVDFGWHSYDDGFEVVGVSSTPNGAADDGNPSIDQGHDGNTDNVGADIENVLGSAGPDYIEGTADVNRLSGAGHNDRLLGMGANDVLDGDSGDDLLEGGTENDLLRGGDQDDRLFGGDNDDTLDGGTGYDILNGEADDDTITYAGRTGRVAVTLDGLRNDGADPNGNGISALAEEADRDRLVENITGGDGDDILTAQLIRVVSIIRGNLGNDTVNVRDNDSTFAETDRLLCGLGTDSFAMNPADVQNSCEIALP